MDKLLSFYATVTTSGPVVEDINGRRYGWNWNFVMCLMEWNNYVFRCCGTWIHFGVDFDRSTSTRVRTSCAVQITRVDASSAHSRYRHTD